MLRSRRVAGRRAGASRVARVVRRIRPSAPFVLLLFPKALLTGTAGASPTRATDMDGPTAAAPLRPTPLIAAWGLAILLNVLKVVGIAQVTGLTRVLTGSFATREDYQLMSATYGEVPGEPIDPFGTRWLRRLAAIHRNEMEIVPLFCVLSYAYILSEPPLREACALLGMFTLARLGHTVFYACACSPARSLAWGVATQALLIMAGRLAAWIFPAAAVALQLVINAPIALQWFVSLGVLGTVREQSARAERRDRPWPEGGDKPMA